VDVRVEHHREPLGIGEATPRISWKIATEQHPWVQTAYQVEISDPVSRLVERSPAVRSPESILVPWPGRALRSRDRRVLRVRAWSAAAATPWSPPLALEAGLLEPEAWQAGLVVPGWEGDPESDQPAAYLRRTFTLPDGPIRARLYVTAHGVYEIELNGLRVGDHVLAPGWTSYEDRLRYQVFDVTGHLAAGENCVGAIVADGWYRGHLGFRGGRRNVYGQRTGLIAQLEIELPDGTTSVVATDGLWRASTGPIVTSSLYHGETHDARCEIKGWSTTSFDASGWSPVQVLPASSHRLVAPMGPPVRRHERLRPQIERREDGRFILDFGQVIVGRLRIAPCGPSGTLITIRHAEVLEDGELCVRPLRAARATDRLILAGTGSREEWEPRFTLHGFRYAEITGWPGVPHEDDVEAWVIHSDLERTGWFECSDPDLSRLHENVVWSMRGNFVDVPTDCPQRDERLGWTGDLQVFAPTASFLFDVSGFLTSWLRDLAADQRRYGTVPAYVPWARFTFPAIPIAAWGDAAVIVPWVVGHRFADRGLLEAQYESMVAWVDQVSKIAPGGLWDSGFQFGDWLDPSAPADSPGAGRTDPSLVATAYHHHTALIVSSVAATLGRPAEAQRFAVIAERARTAFRREFASSTGRVVSDSQTAYALALQFGLLDPGDESVWAARRLVRLVREAGHRIATGFVGTPLICDALTEADAVDEAYGLVLQRACPSWLYPVTMGATTIWERWDSMLPDGSVNPGQMTSFNHYAFGAIGDWLHRVVAGLAPAGPGYRRLEIAPRPGGGLTSAVAVHETPYGRAEVRWTRSGERFELFTTIPPGTTARVRLPDAASTTQEIGSGTHHFACRMRPATQDPQPGPLPDIHSTEAP